MNTDYSEIINSYGDLIDKIKEYYAEFPELEDEKLAKIEEVNKQIEAATESRSENLVKIAANEVDAQIEQWERLIDLSKSMDGLTLGGELFTYDAEDEIAAYEQIIAYNLKVIDGYAAQIAAGERLSNVAYSDYQNRLVLGVGEVNGGYR